MSELGAMAVSRPADVGTVAQAPATPPAPPSAGVQRRPISEMGRPLEGAQAAEPAVAELAVEASPEQQPDEQAPPEQEAAPLTMDALLDDVELTPEQHAQIIGGFREALREGRIPDMLRDFPLIVPNGKNGNVLVRLGDIDQNVLLYNDYQEKTTTLAKQRRELQAINEARQAWLADLTSGDAALGMRALNAVGAADTICTLAIEWIHREAAIEALPESMREQYRRGLEAQEQYELLQRRMQAQQQAASREQEQTAQQQGMDAPDIQYTLRSMEERFPRVLDSLGVADSEDLQQELGRLISTEVNGQRSADGSWIRAPRIQRGRPVSDGLLRELVVAARQNLDQLVARHSGRMPRAKTAALPPTLQQTGPAAKPGAVGNIAAPQRKRISEMK